MKKKVLLSISLACALSMAACAAPAEQSSPSAKEFVSEVLLNSFENYYDCYDFHYSGKFRMDFVNSENAVTDGDKAIQLTYDAVDKDQSTSMSVGVPLSELSGTENNYRDFSNMSHVTFDVYNASETEVTVATSIMKKVIGYGYANTQAITVAANTKATVTYSVNRYEIYYSLGIAGGTHVNVGVSGTNPVVCIDNMRLHYVEDDFVEPEMTIAENEIIQFEKAYQAFAVSTTGSVFKAEVVADVEKASQGNCFVRVYRDGYEDGQVLWGGGKFTIPPNYLSKINFDKYADTAYIAYDYKTSWATGGSMWAVPRLVSTESGGYANIRGANLVSDGEWHTFYIPLKWSPTFFDTIEIDLSGGSYGDIYFDNFRIVDSVPKGTEGKYIATGYGLT